MSLRKPNQIDRFVGVWRLTPELFFADPDGVKLELVYEPNAEPGAAFSEPE